MAAEGAPAGRIEPVLQGSFLCDGIAQDPNTQKLTLIGLFETILRPSVMTQFYVVNKWVNGVGTFRQTLEILGPDLTPLRDGVTQDFTLPNRILSMNLISGFVNFNFPVAGVFWIQIRLDGNLTLAYPLPVLQPVEAQDPRIAAQPTVEN